MVKKSDIVKDAVRDQDWKKALQIAKDFHIGVTQEQRSRMARAYECMVHPDFYKQIGVDIAEAIEQGKAVVKEYAESGRKDSMKWDVKHDKAKRVIDMFLEGADTWQKTGEFVVPNRSDLTGDLTDEDKALVSEEVATMIASIRKRYKLQERLPEPVVAETVPAVEQEVEPIPEAATEPVAEVKPEEPAEAAPEPEKPKRGRRASTGEKKTTSRRKKKEVQEGEQS